MDKALSFVSAVVVVDGAGPSPAEIERLATALAGFCTDLELVLVANAVPDTTARELKRLVSALPDVTCHFLADAVEQDTARVIGIDHAIGDHVLLTNATAAELPVLASMAAAMHEGFDLAVAEPRQSKTPAPFLYGVFRRVFFAALNTLSAVEISTEPPSLRLMSRPAALYLLSQLNAELLLRARSLGPGFPAKILPDAYDGDRRQERGSFRKVMERALRGVVTTSAAPLRLAAVLGFVSGMLAFLYIFYVALIYMFKAEVQPGWTTMSLQLSGLTMMLSFILALIAEYILQIHARMPLRRRYGVTREIRSPHSRRSGRRNIVDDSGLLELGLPADLIGKGPPEGSPHA